MPSRRTAAVRAASLPSLRAIGFGATAIPVSAVSHCLAGGSTPSLLTVVLAWTIVALAHRLALARTEQSWLVLAATLTLIQLGLHLLWAGAEPRPSTGHPLPHVAAHVAQVAQAAGHGLGHDGLSGRMVLAHAVAGALLGFLLRCGEAALWSTARHLAHRLSLVVHVLRALAGTTTIDPCDCPARWQAWPTPWLDPATRRHRVSGGRYWRGPPAVLPGHCAA